MKYVHVSLGDINENCNLNQSGLNKLRPIPKLRLCKTVSRYGTLWDFTRDRLAQCKKRKYSQAT